MLGSEMSVLLTPEADIFVRAVSAAQQYQRTRLCYNLLILDMWMVEKLCEQS